MPDCPRSGACAEENDPVRLLMDIAPLGRRFSNKLPRGAPPFDERRHRRKSQSAASKPTTSAKLPITIPAMPPCDTLEPLETAPTAGAPVTPFEVDVLESDESVGLVVWLVEVEDLRHDVLEPSATWNEGEEKVRSASRTDI